MPGQTESDAAPSWSPPSGAPVSSLPPPAAAAVLGFGSDPPPGVSTPTVRADADADAEGGGDWRNDTSILPSWPFAAGAGAGAGAGAVDRTDHAPADPPDVVSVYGAPGAAPPRRWVAMLSMLLVTGLLAGLIGGVVGFRLVRDRDAVSGVSPGAAPLPQAPGDIRPRDESTIAGVARTVLPSVVSLEVSSGTGSGGTGSGFVFRPDGLIVTNSHVIAGAVEGGAITVSFSDGATATGSIVGRNTSADIAVVRVDRADLPAVTVAQSPPGVGDLVIAVGSPLGLRGTVTVGIVSALDRPVTAGGQGETSFLSAIQTDAAINPGNSGGPLVNGAGAVVGVNAATATLAQGAGRGGSIGLGFAIPIAQAARIANEIIDTGRSATPVIGVQLDLAYPGPGARIGAVTPGGSAEAGGLQVGDVVTGVDGRPVADATEFVVALRRGAPGDTVSLTRSDGSIISVVLAADTATE